MVCGPDYGEHDYVWTTVEGKPRRECSECGTVHAGETRFAREALRRAIESGALPEHPP